MSNTPQVRFAGFTGAWEQRKFGDFTFPAGERNKDDLDLEPFAITNNQGFIAQSEAHDDFGYMKNVDRKMYIVVKPNSFAYNPARINVGSLGYYEGTENVIVSSLYEVFQTAEYVDDKFLNHWFKTKAFQDWIERLQEGSVRLYFYYDKLCECIMSMPSVEEQRKIGPYLDKIDNLIALQQRKCDALQKFKKSMLQKMFPQNGESVPEIRFAGFTDTWEQRKLKNITERIIVGLATSVTPYYRDKGIPLLRNMNIKENYLDDSDVLYLDEAYANANESKKIHTDDVLTVHTGSNIGLTCLAPEEYDGCLSFTTLITTPQKDILDSSFLMQYMNSDDGKNNIFSIITSGGKPNLNSGDLEKLEILYPSLEEQKRISTFLFNLDTLITLHRRKLETLQKMKKSLLQKMFPPAGRAGV